MKARSGRKAADFNCRTFSIKRRKLLGSCVALPTVTLLAGCGGGGTELAETKGVTGAAEPGIPLPPYAPGSPEAAMLPPTVAEPLAPVPVTHLPPVLPPKSAGPLKMNVGVYNLEYNTWTQVPARKKAAAPAPAPAPAPRVGGLSRFAAPVAPPAVAAVYDETIEVYLARALADRFALLYRAMETAFAARPPTAYDVSFFTASEFYWNVPWSEFLDTGEVDRAADIYQNTVKENVLALIKKFPACKYGNIVLLPGSVAVLRKDNAVVDKKGAIVGSAEAPLYKASNHLVCTHNLPLDDKDYPRAAYMVWPKRVVSGIDFIDEASGLRCESGAFSLSAWTYQTTTPLPPDPSDPSADNYVYTCALSTANKLTVKIASVSSEMAQSFDKNGQPLPGKFANNIIKGLPFGIDVCLDYMDANLQTDQSRMAQLDVKNFKLDFVLSCGIGLSSDNYASAPFIQYAIHNDGYPTSNENLFNRNLLFSNIERIVFNAGPPPTVYLSPMTPVGGGYPEDPESLIHVDESDAYVPPAGADSTGIPVSIPDHMNPVSVRVWSLPVDVTDTLESQQDIAAMKPKAC